MIGVRNVFFLRGKQKHGVCSVFVLNVEQGQFRYFREAAAFVVVTVPDFFCNGTHQETLSVALQLGLFPVYAKYIDDIVVVGRILEYRE